MRKKPSSQRILKKNVLEQSLCTGCGACVGLCPYQVIYHDRTVQLHDCDLTDGQCYAFCPRTPTDINKIQESLFDIKDLTPEIGAVKDFYFVRAADPQLRGIAQHGGTVTALLELAVDEGIIDSAIVSSRNSEITQHGIALKDKAALRHHAGSKFTVSPTVAALHQVTTTQDAGNIGVVATPCQAMALAKMKMKPASAGSDKIDRLKLVIGLFCGWTLAEEKFKMLLARNNIAVDAISSMDIPAGKNSLEILTATGVQSIAIDEVQACIRGACNYCLDSTAEFADISIGAARFGGSWEEMRKWNQVIVRTQKGREIFDLAVKRSVLEIREAHAENLLELKKAALQKKMAGLKNIISKSGSVNNLLYLDPSDPMIKKLLATMKEKKKVR
jgi:coenzyme F420 hydrogenase subunit beta